MKKKKNNSETNTGLEENWASGKVSNNSEIYFPRTTGRILLSSPANNEINTKKKKMHKTHNAWRKVFIMPR